ncbi:signal transduction histidine kinase [Hypnocyclicus thermotrophus]|uniref:histidine kinase n=1 Tax=Hypnocyclicus thermotrophus TaxID=1627895 RepID=A0AA46I5W2_9FUSO|nr:ATP-binding protein [Hypnocyclicus thermotrophus]TDT71772.1 signal transduction histidine kinase [Hypnocyclicus thermotrophus]
MKYRIRNSIKLKLIVSVLTIIVVTIALATFYNINLFIKNTNKELLNLLSTQSISANIILNNNIEKFALKAKNITQDSTLTNLLQMQLYKKIDDFSKNILNKNPDIDEIIIFNKNNNSISHPNLSNNSFIKNFIKSKKSKYSFWNDNGNLKIIVNAPILTKSKTQLGSLVLIQNIQKQKYNISQLSKKINTTFILFDNSKLVFISDSNGHIKDSTQIKYDINLKNIKNNIYAKQKIKIDNNNYYVLYTPLVDFHNNIIGFYGIASNIKQLDNSITSIIFNMIIMSIFGCIFATIFLLILANILLNPLHTFIETAKDIGNGHYSKRINIKNNDEIGILAHYFNDMLDKLENNIIEIEKKNERLKELDKIKDDFLANTSHELRTPLNGIIGLTESLLEGAGGKLSKKTEFNLNMIMSSAKRLFNLVSDILDFAKIRNKELEISLKDIDIYQITAVVTTLCRVLIGNKDIKLINKISKNFPIIYGDDARIEQILYNLIGNAIKFTHKGEIIIDAKINEKKDTAIFYIKDSGIGIAPEKLDKIFESFEQGDSSISRKFGGTGLGLSITKQLIELQGGSIYVESTLGKGTTFVFTLPISDEVDQDRMFEEEVIREQIKREKKLKDRIKNAEKQNLNKAYLPKFNPNNSNKNILIVDDEYINLQVLVDQLLLKNYNIDVAMSGEEALEKIKNFNYDLLILDVMMPRMSGYEVCKEVRKTYSLFNLPILMLTAKDRTEDIILGFESGANDYITKPFEKKELYARVNTLLRLKYAIEVSLQSTYEYFTQKEKSDTLESLQKITNDFNSDLNSEKILFKLKKIFKDISKYTNFEYLVKIEKSYYSYTLDALINQTVIKENLVPLKNNPYLEFIEKNKTPKLFKDTNKNIHMKKTKKNTHILIIPAIYGESIVGAVVLEIEKIINKKDINYLFMILSQATLSLQNSNLLLKIAEEVKKVEKAMDELTKTQEQLILSEKMAVLGGLVAGISHEINTPIGIGVTAASTLEESTSNIKKKYEKSIMTRNDLEMYLDDADTSSKLILSNLNRASDLIKSFKQISVDQTIQDKRKFKVYEYINEVFLSLYPKIKRTNYEINLKCDKELEITSYPGDFSQIITNFVINSLNHGFENSNEGIIDIIIEKKDNQIIFKYKDNGKGMSEEHRKKIFDPFFTTKRDKGGSGLGMHIVYNIVTQRLKGNIKCISAPFKGTEFIITFPLEN